MSLDQDLDRAHLPPSFKVLVRFARERGLLDGKGKEEAKENGRP